MDFAKKFKELEPSTFEEEMIIARSIIGVDEWQNLPREEKIKITKKLKSEVCDANQYQNSTNQYYQ
jgi:hypothetical protein